MDDQENTNDSVKESSSNETSEQERSPRALDSRDASQRIESWDNPTNLPAPNPRPGWDHRYVMTRVLGDTQIGNTNVNKRFREGWSPCKLEEYPEFNDLLLDYNSDWVKKGHIEIGGQVLCKMPAELAEARKERLRDHAQTQMESVDNIYLKDNDPRMPKQVFERKSRTTFGRDS